MRLERELKNNSDMKTSKSKTFQKGDDYGEVIEWFMKQLEVHEYQPEGTEWSGGEPGPFDPVCELKAKYTITIVKTEETLCTSSTTQH